MSLVLFEERLVALGLLPEERLLVGRRLIQQRCGLREGRFIIVVKPALLWYAMSRTRDKTQARRSHRWTRGPLTLHDVGGRTQSG